MEYFDLVPQTYTTKSSTYNTVIRPTANGYPGTGTISGSLSSVYDVNTATYYQYYLYHSGDGNTCGELNVDAIWTTPVTIKNSYIYSSYYFHAGNYNSREVRLQTYLKVDGVWTSIASSTSTTFAADTWHTYSPTITGPWDLVTGIRHYMYGFNYSYEGDRKQQIYLRMHEIRANREKYTEVMRIRKTGTTLRIGGLELAASHKLRIKDNDAVRGIPFVTATDPNVSPLKIYDGSTARFLPLADA